MRASPAGWLVGPGIQVEPIILAELVQAGGIQVVVYDFPA